MSSINKADNRVQWRLIHHKYNVYLIQSTVNFPYILSTGEKPGAGESDWSENPKCVMSDANYDNRALWEIN